MIAAITDMAIQILLSLAAAAVFILPLSSTTRGFATAFFATAVLVIWVFYNPLFETFRSGRTPGKSVMGLRVIKNDGGPVGFFSASIRGLFWIIEGPASGFVIGLVVMLVSFSNQRLGDVVAGTMVVRDRVGSSRKQAPVAEIRAYKGAANWDLGAVTDEHMAPVRSFLARREKLTPDARTKLASTLDGHLRPLVVGETGQLDPEEFLEALVARRSVSV